jgi:transposase-like protein
MADYAESLPVAVKCFDDDFEACITHLRLPVTHRRSTRTTNLIERLFGEERRRMKIVPNWDGDYGRVFINPLSVSAAQSMFASLRKRPKCCVVAN